MDAIERHRKKIVPLTFVLTAITILLVAGMMVITFVDVFGRYVLNSPVPGAFELVKFMLGLSIFACYPLVTKNNGHINVSIVDNLLKGRPRWMLQLVILLFSLGIMLLILVSAWTQAESLRQSNFISQFLEFPIAPIVYAMSVFCVIAILFQIGLIWKHFNAGSE